MKLILMIASILILLGCDLKFKYDDRVKIKEGFHSNRVGHIHSVHKSIIFNYYTLFLDNGHIVFREPESNLELIERCKK